MPRARPPSAESCCPSGSATPPGGVRVPVAPGRAAVGRAGSRPPALRRRPRGRRTRVRARRRSRALLRRCPEGGCTGRERLDRRHPESLVGDGREDEEICGGIEAPEVVLGERPRKRTRLWSPRCRTRSTRSSCDSPLPATARTRWSSSIKATASIRTSMPMRGSRRRAVKRRRPAESRAGRGRLLGFVGSAKNSSPTAPPTT